MLYNPYKFPIDNIIGLNDSLASKVNKSGDIMTGDLNVWGDNTLIYEGNIGSSNAVQVTNGSTITVKVAGTEVYSGVGTTNRPVYIVNETDEEVNCIPYNQGSMASKNHSWSAKIYKVNEAASLNASGDVKDGYGNTLSSKANNSALDAKANTSIIANAFSTATSYAVGDYVMYSGVLYKCTTAHSGAWNANDFTAVLVSDEFGSGGGVADLSAIAPEFSTSTAYAIDDYVTYEGKLYRCTTAHAAGAWNASDFTETNVAASKANKSTSTVETLSGQFAIGSRGSYTVGQTVKNNLSIGSANVSGTGSLAIGKSLGTPTNVSSVSGDGSAAIGQVVSVSGNNSVGIGVGASVSHNRAFATGNYTKTGADNQTVVGKYNEGKATNLFEVGNGTADNARSNAFEVEADGDVNAAGEFTDGGGNVLSDKYDATSLTFPNERFTITASSWSSTQTGGYYTYTLNTGTTKYNTYCPVFMDKTGVNDSTDPTAAEAAAYALVDKFDMADGTGVNSFTLYAKTKPTTTFYIKLSGQYMAKNAASSTKALDITTGCKLTLGDALGNTYEFDGSTERTYIKRNIGILVSSSNWTSTVDASGYYTNTIDLGYGFNVYNDPRIRPYPTGNNNEVTAAEGAAYNLVDVWYMDDGTNVSQLVAKAKTKPTTTFKIRVVGDSMS